MTKDTAKYPKILKTKPDTPKEPTKVIGGGHRTEGPPEIKQQGRRGG